MTASLLPIIAAKPVPFVPSSKLPSSAVQKASQRGAATGRGPIRLRVENAMDELKTAAAAASRGARRAAQVPLRGPGDRLIPFAHERQDLLAKAPYVGHEIDECQQQAADAGIPLERRDQLRHGLIGAVQDRKAHESQIALLNRR